MIIKCLTLILSELFKSDAYLLTMFTAAGSLAKCRECHVLLPLPTDMKVKLLIKPSLIAEKLLVECTLSTPHEKAKLHSGSEL